MKKLFPFIIPSVLAVLLVLTAGCSKKSREAKFLLRADKYFAAGDYDQAEIEYINAIRIDHESARAYGQLGIMAFQQSRMQRAYAFLNRSCQLDTNNLDYRVQFGMINLVAGRRDKARDEAVYVLTKRPDDAEAPGLLADTATTVGDIDKVKEYLQKLNVPPAKSAPIETAIGTLDLRERDLTAALAAFERAKAADPKFGPVYSALANYYWSQKDLKRADEAFKSSIDSAPPRSLMRLKYAQFKLQTGDTAGAKHILEESLKTAPDYLPGMTTLAGIAAGEKKYDEANDWLTKVLSRDSDNYDALSMSGRLGMLTGDSDKAVAQFEKMSLAYPKSPPVLYQLGLAYNAAGDTTKAFATLNQAIAQNTNFAQAILALAEMKVAKGDFSSAIVSLQQLIQQQPKMPEAKLLLADTYKRQGDLDSAAKVYRKLEQEFPDNAQTPLLLGMILMQQQKRQEARQEFTHALELAPDYLSALEQLTTLDLGEGHATAALERVQREMEKNPKDPESSILLAKIYVSQKNVPQAVASLQKTIELHPDFIEGSFTLAEVYADSGQDQKALDTMHGLLAKHPDQIGTWMLLGMIEDKLKDYKAARDAYEKVLSLDPKKSVALNNLAYIYSEHNDLDKGYELARRARVLLPYDSSTADTLGWILYKKGDFNQAAGLLGESATQQPDEPDIQLHLGLTLYMLGDEDGARVALQKALQAKTLPSGADVAQQRVTILMVDPKTATPEVRVALEKQVDTLPNDSIALSRLAAIYKRDGAADKAITAEEAAMKANPKNARVVLDLAQLYSTQPGQTAKALELAKAAYKLAPADPGTVRTLGHLSLLSGDYKFSQNLLLQAARQSPGDPELLYDLAQATYSQGQVADAESEMRTALQGGASFTHAAEAKHFLDMVALSASPQSAVAATAQVQQNLNSDANYVPALMAMGGINEQKPDAAAAIQNYEKVLDRYPDFVPAKRRLAVLYAAQPAGDNAKAYAVAIKAYQAYPDDADVSRALGIILYRQGEFTKSSQRLKEITAKKTGDAQAMYYLGMDQYQLKQTAESKKNLQRAMELKLPNDLASEAQRVLASLK